MLDDWARHRTSADVVDRATLLGLCRAEIPAAAPEACAPWRWSGEAGTRTGLRPGALVVDLSALWAGPLCGQLLGLSGARVVRVESTGRPDGSRRGAAAFDDLLHAGQASVDFTWTPAPGCRTGRTAAG